MPTIVAGSPTVTLHWKDPTSVPLLPTAPSGYQVSPSLSSKLDMNSSGHLVSSGQLQSSDAGIYNITSTDFTGTLIVMLKISSECHRFVLTEIRCFVSCPVAGMQSISVRWMTPITRKILPTNFTEISFSRLMINSSGYFLSNGLLFQDAQAYMLTSPNYEGTFIITIIVYG